LQEAQFFIVVTLRKAGQYETVQHIQTVLAVLCVSFSLNKHSLRMLMMQLRIKYHTSSYSYSSQVFAIKPRGKDTFNASAFSNIPIYITFNTIHT
jgi:hypothetical protein